LPSGDLASGAYDTTIKIWDSLTGSLKRTLTGHTDGVHALAMLKNGDLASCSDDKKLKIWDYNTGVLKMT